MSAGWFVTGTDTGVGKSLVSCALLRLAAARGLRCLGMKPVAAGCELREGEWRNEDVEALVAASTVAAPRALVNPYRLKPAIAPHLAAAEEGVVLEAERILACLEGLRAQADIVVVEGAGGFLVPLDERIDLGELARRAGLPMILVVGMRLGCLNHALLTAEAIRTRGLALAGWVANRIDPAMSRFEDNVGALRARLGAPLLGVIPHLATPSADRAAECLSLPPEAAGDGAA